MAFGGCVEKGYRLSLLNVPEDFTFKAIIDLCSKYGKVLAIQKLTSTPYVFVTFDTYKDLITAMIGLKDHPHGIVPDFASGTCENQDTSAANTGHARGDENRNPFKQNEVDMSRRLTDHKRFCGFCGDPGGMMCQRCGECYCCYYCQMADWTRHKFICGRILSLIPAQPIAGKPRTVCKPFRH